MPEVKTTIFTTYETTDGRDDFDSLQEAETWQKYLDTIASINMLDTKFNHTTDMNSVSYVHIQTPEQLEAFNAVVSYEYQANISDIGYWYYNDRSDKYLNLDDEIYWLQSVKDRLLSKEI